MFKKTGSCSPLAETHSQLWWLKPWSPWAGSQSPKRPCCLQEDSACKKTLPALWRSRFDQTAPLAFPPASLQPAGLFPQILSGWACVLILFGSLMTVTWRGSAATPAPPVSPQSSVSFSSFSPVHFSVCLLSPALECEPQHSRNLSRPTPHPGLAGPHFGLVS